MSATTTNNPFSTAGGRSTQRLFLLDYGAGNVRSLLNAVHSLGYEIEFITKESDFDLADKIIFPGVGAFGYAIEAMKSKGFCEPLKNYIASGRPLMGICVGMQVLFEGSDEAPDVSGLGIIPGRVRKFKDTNKAVPQIGWNSVSKIPQYTSANGLTEDRHLSFSDGQRFYFVHSYAVPFTGNPELSDWAYTSTRYRDEAFVSSIWKGNVFATQFHPEKSGKAGVELLRSFIESPFFSSEQGNLELPAKQKLQPSSFLQPDQIPDGFTVRVIACLDVRANDQGDLVVTKGDQYDVRESAEDGGNVRNLGKPVELAERYYKEGADEIAFLNITSFRDIPFKDTPMLEVLKQASRTIFVPLTIGGGVRDITDPTTGEKWLAKRVAGEYFRSGADKVSIGSDAVYAAEEYWKNNKQCAGNTSIEQIAESYGAQAVVISVDPRRVYVQSPEQTAHSTVKTKFPGPNGEQYCWYQCTVKGGREGRDLDVIQLVTACQAIGAGEILLNCMDKDGTNSGYDHELIGSVKKAVQIPVIASSGAGCPAHFSDVVEECGAEAVLAAGIFHRREVPIADVKGHLTQKEIPVRPSP
ncbi:Histidine biosynthesis bifunctional protein hisB [Mycoemilia scoparia]|uniref:Imidazole glycerol phosphate synthase hisHF n=1 Tax=Mycoemilia scoparia TaxID=417184 RepID=A0A9W7ZUC7_9FUNG|nr:Histidine biosynthesis bifunctional protein hisB [Mycoemilia scoparia]